ncbi:MAG: ABC transporter permease subunit [Myxococcales bacterium]|nr:ABC transporter permease subunit [Myxococcales bacterium]
MARSAGQPRGAVSAATSGESEPIEDAGGSTFAADAWRRLRKNRAAVASLAVLGALLLGCILVPALGSYGYADTDLALGPTPPSWAHWMGTDLFGRDLMVRVFFGGRVSFAVGVVSTAVSFVIGVTWGSVAGFFGRRIDAVMMRIVDALYTFPFLIFVILLSVFFANQGGLLHRAFVRVLGLFTARAHDPSYFPVFQIVFVFAALGAASWLTMARIVRGQVIALRAQPFVEAARSIGATEASILVRHVLPNALGPIIVYATLTVPEVMLTEAFLSFLGLGTQEPLASWGLLAASGAETMDVYPWVLVFPALMLAVTLFCFNHLGDGLRDALDPRIRKD